MQDKQLFEWKELHSLHFSFSPNIQSFIIWFSFFGVSIIVIFILNKLWNIFNISPEVFSFAIIFGLDFIPSNKFWSIFSNELILIYYKLSHSENIPFIILNFPDLIGDKSKFFKFLQFSNV